MSRLLRHGCLTNAQKENGIVQKRVSSRARNTAKTTKEKNVTDSTVYSKQRLTAQVRFVPHTRWWAPRGTVRAEVEVETTWYYMRNDLRSTHPATRHWRECTPDDLKTLERGLSPQAPST
jgi:hypothetical protein